VTGDNQVTRPTCVQHSVKDTRVIAQLDKLNVYSAGDLLNGHIDTPTVTPQSTNMLLINLPLAHEGGAADCACSVQSLLRG
jgi:hypothetical protein